MRRPLQLGQKSRRLQEKGARRSKVSKVQFVHRSRGASPYFVGPVITRARQGRDKPMQGRITCQVNFLHSNRK